MATRLKPAPGRAPLGAQGLWRALAMLGAFSDERPEWSLADLARAQELSKPTALRILGALERAGFVARSGLAGGYRLGTAAIELGARAQRATRVTTVARPELETLARQTGETTSLEILHRDEALILDEVHGQHRLGTAPAIGTRWPAHATSTGKVLLAAARCHLLEPAQAAAATLPGALRRFTPRTITGAAAVEQELRRVAGRGYATVVGELEPDFVAVAAPIRNHLGQVVAALSAGGPASRLTPAELARITPLVVRAAGRVSARLGAPLPQPVE
jgi:IclR family transcriptional regulator, acetate operon repressor